MDRLSRLPNVVRARIISLLPTTEAIRTQVISHEWQCACTSLPKLDFSQFGNPKKGVVEYKEEFKNCVEKMLAGHDETDIEYFSIFVMVDGECITSLDISSWITILVKHNIQNLSLWVYSMSPLDLPSTLFTCHSLECLRLVDVRLRMPTSIHFPMLKSLVLEGVKFEDRYGDIYDEDKAEYVDDVLGNKLFSATTCPSLEKLEIFFCDSLFSLTIFNPFLKYLKLTTRNSSKFKLCIPSLRELVYRGVAVDISAETLSSLRAATVAIVASFEYPCYDASTILSGLRNVETLTLELSFVELLSWDTVFSSNAITLSTMLKHLHLEILPIDNQVHAVKFLASSFPLLQTLCIRSKYFPPDANCDEESKPASELYIKDIKDSVICHLQTVEVEGFQGSDCEVELVRFLFARSTVLEEMKISWGKKDVPSDKTKISEAVLNLYKVSSHALLAIRDTEMIRYGKNSSFIRFDSKIL